MDPGDRGYPRHGEAGQCRRTEPDQAGGGGYGDQACGLGQERAGALPPHQTPPSLVRLGRTERFRRTVRFIAQTLDLDADACSARLVAGLAMLAQAMDKDLAEADWWRLLNALLLIATYPAVSPYATR